MDNVLFKYSEFFEDDGGFDKIYTDFDALGDRLIKKAREIKSSVNLFDLDQVDQIKEMETQTESLSKAFKKYGDAKEQVTKIEEEFNKLRNKQNQSQDEAVDKLVQLDKRLQEYRGNLKEVNQLAKLGIKTDRDLNKERVEAKLNIKKVTKEIRDQEKEVLKANELTRKQTKLLEAQIVLEREQIKTLDDVRERMSALRTVVKSLDLEEDAEKIKAFNAEIDELTELLSDNSDKFIQSKINIGNYEESITNALKSSSLFKTNLGFLDNALDSVLALLFLNKEQLDALEASTKQNTNAIKRFALAFGRLNKVLKASIIGVILIAIAALGSAFGDTRAGAIRTEKVMLTLSSAFQTFGKVATTVFTTVGTLIEVFINSIADLVNDNKDKSFTELLKDFFSGDIGITDAIGKNLTSARVVLSKGFNDLKKIFESGGEAIVKGLENIERAFRIEDEIRGIRIEVAKLNGELQIAQSIADDSSKSLSTQLLANSKALELTTKIGERNLDIARKELEVINERVKQNVLANGVEVGRLNLGRKGVGFANDVLNLAKQRGASLEISNDLIDQQQAKVLEVINAENELSSTVQENFKKRREIQRNLFEQNLDLLIDLIDTEKNLSEQFVNDVTKSFENRINEFNRFLVKFRINAQKELEEFNKLARDTAKILQDEISSIDPTTDFGKERIEDLQKELKKIEDLDFQIVFDDNGDFEIFNNGVALTLEDIVELNKELQALGIAEIPINRLREFNVETSNAVRDFKSLGKEIRLANGPLKEFLEANVSVSQDELRALDALQEKIDALRVASRGDLSESERNNIIKQIEELEKQKSAITLFADEERLLNRRDAIDKELDLVQEGSQRYYELIEERISIEKQLRENGINESLEKTKEANKKALEDYKKFGEEVRDVLDSILDKVLEVNRERLESAKEQVDKQGELIDEQRRRAELGLTNTLAFEQRQLAEREAELIRQEQRQQRLEKIRALYSSYSNYASRGEQYPIAKALHDFAILEAITASFGDGGVVEDKLPRDGIFRGPSHQSKSGGIPILVEGQEGIFSKKEMNNLGKDNFYKLKEMAGSGSMDSNFLVKQRRSFIQQVPVKQTDPALIHEMREVKRAVEKKPVSRFDVNKLADGILEIVETVTTKNKTTRNHYKTKKPRL